MTKRQILRLIKSPAVWLLVGIAISLMILGIRVISQADQYVTVEMIASGGDWWERLPQVPHWLADPVVPGAAEYSIGGQKLAEILETKKYQEDTNKILWAKVKLLVTPDKARGGWRFQQMPLEIGSTLTIEPNSVKLTGSVIAIEGVGAAGNYKSVVATVKLYYRRPWLNDAINVGDKAADDQGNVAAEVLEKSSALAERTITTASGQVFVGHDPLYRDITLKLKLQAVNRGGKFYFNQIQPIKIGNKLWIPFGNVNLWEAEIIDFR